VAALLRCKEQMQIEFVFACAAVSVEDLTMYIVISRSDVMGKK